LQLLEQSKLKDEKTLDLIVAYKSELPLENELKTAGLIHGQNISLPCWDLTILIP
jgi:hypothetical protein